METKVKARGRGFAAMTPEKLRAIASMGGKAAHLLETAHEWTPEEARAAIMKRWQAISEKGGATNGSRTDRPI